MGKIPQKFNEPGLIKTNKVSLPVTNCSRSRMDTQNRHNNRKKSSLELFSVISHNKHQADSNHVRKHGTKPPPSTKRHQQRQFPQNKPNQHQQI